MSASHEEHKTLEMRVAAIEDKLSKLSVSEEEMRSYKKVSALLGGTHSPCIAASPNISQISITGLCHISPIIHTCIIFQPCIITPPIINDCIQFSGTGAAASTGFEALGK